MLGWPCGTSLRTGGATFHKWQLPVAQPSVHEVHATEEAAAEPYVYVRIEEAAVEHQLDCVSEDAALNGEGEGGAGAGAGAGAGGERARDREL